MRSLDGSCRWVVLLAWWLVGVPAAPPDATLYLSPQGDDAWSGKLPEPNAARTDGPLATLTHARDELRRLRAAGPPAPQTVYLRGGVYRVEQTLEFTPADSGTEAAPVTWAAYPGERPVISGARALGGWRKGPGSLWQTVVPQVKAGAWYFHQLTVNGQRRTRARTPNVGYLYTLGIVAPFNRARWWASDIAAKEGFRYRGDDLKAWHNPDDAMVVIYHSWTTSLHYITGLDPQERLVKLAPKSGWPIGYWWEYNTRYHVENILEALDEPGEWYLDRASGVLSYWPKPGEDLTRALVEAPVVVQTLLRFAGQPEAQQPVAWLRFRGLSFQHTDPLLTRDMPVDQQGAVERKAMIAARGLRHAEFDHCELVHAGENGLLLDAGCSDNVIRHCELHDLGGGAIYLMPEPYSAKPELAVERNVVDNCWLHDGSNLFRGSSGVLVGRASYNRITHNEISGFHHIGLSCGWSWGYAPTTAHDNLLAYNHIHHICNGLFSDGGGIYTLGLSPGTVIRNNVVHDVVPTPLMPVGGCGIYHDEGSTGIVVENNLVYRTGAAAYTQHYGENNLARNNIFAFAGTDPICCWRPEEHRSYTFEGNIVQSDRGQVISDHASPLKAKTEFRHNLYWDLSTPEPKFAGVSWSKWRETGRDQDSQLADPQFLDPRHDDFRLKPDSPALAMGFKPFDPHEAGLYGDRAWVGAPAKVPYPPLPKLPEPPPPPPPTPYREGFEADATGKQPQTLGTYPEDKVEAIAVTEEAAATGKKSLKLTKIDGLRAPWMPHVLVSTRPYTEGKVHFACDLMNHPEHPTACSIALRDYSHKDVEYQDGPALQLQTDGTLQAGDKVLTKIPAGQWIHLDIEVDLGQAGKPGTAAKTYRVTVTVAGQAAQLFSGLPYSHPRFEQTSWAGFSVTGPVGTSLYIDNLRFEGENR